MSHVPEDLFYTRNHEWLRRLSAEEVEIGITDHAQCALGDLVFVELPEIGRRLTAGAAVAVVESVKAASDVYSPCSGTVVAANAQLADQPELLNSAPYGEGWLLRVAMEAAAGAPEDGEALLTAAEYREFVASAAH